MLWYKQNTEQLYEVFDTGDSGLSSEEALSRLGEYGQNQLAIKKESIWKVIIAPFKDIFVGVLVVAATVSLLSHKPVDAIIIGVIILINAVIYYSQQYATQKILRSLNKHSIQQVSVIRDGEQQYIPSVNIVPGDIILFVEGERISADARIIHTDNLQTNEASLTGESVPVLKHASTLESSRQIYEQDNMTFQGTYVISGTAKALVVETGGRTEYGKIAELAKDDHSKSPVQTKIDHLVSLLVKVTGVLTIIVYILSLVRGIPAGSSWDSSY